ncbi:MAG: hypothetical protein IIT77_02665 [Oscillospiraceae bacterium]|nr:hypothetical protein [Oscillospiraceae bacterium]
MIKNAQARYMKSYNDKSSPHLKSPDLERVSRQYSSAMQGLRMQEFYNSSVANSTYSALQLATKAYNLANFRLNKALERMAEAEKSFADLRQKQARERAKLEQKHAKAAAKGLTAKESMKQEREKSKLLKKHANQKLRIQQRYLNAKNTAMESEMILDRAKLEIEKYK